MIPKRIFAMIIMLIVAQISCNAPEEGDTLQTAAAETVEAGQTQTAAAQGLGSDSSVATATSPPGADTNTPAPTNTSPPAGTATQSTACDVATFISDVTVPDGADFDPNENFTKTWRLKNVGTCTWTSGYDLVFFSGDSMNAPASQQLTGGTVAPGGTIDVSVDLKAPGSAGTYKGNFKLRNSSNSVFGLTNGNAFWVEIDVIESDPDLVVSQITLDPSTPTKNVPVDVTVRIRNNGDAAAGAFTVKWWGGEGYVIVGCDWAVSGLAASTSTDLNCTYGGYPSTYANINTKASVDTADTVSESNESNNDKLMAISVDP